MRELIPETKTIEQFRDRLVSVLLGGAGSVRRYRLTDAQWGDVRRLAESKYRSFDWNVGRTPRFEIGRTGVLAGRRIDVRIAVEHGRVESVEFGGNLPDDGDFGEIANRLRGTPYDREPLSRALSGFDFRRSVGSVSIRELVALLRD